jgi:hypothetical protein
MVVVVDCTREERKGDSVMTAHPFFKCFLLALSLRSQFLFLSALFVGFPFLFFSFHCVVGTFGGPIAVDWPCLPRQG